MTLAKVGALATTALSWEAWSQAPVVGDCALVATILKQGVEPCVTQVKVKPSKVTRRSWRVGTQATPVCVWGASTQR